MDESVRRALARWPDVPDCYGWLHLDARGNWRVRSEQDSLEGARGARFGVIINRGLIDFINRNYALGERGRYFFQNGPQRVFVECEYTPFVYRLGDDLTELITHTGSRCTGPRRLLIDDEGSVLVDALSGPGVVLDRDLPSLVARLRTSAGAAVEPDELVLAHERPLRVFAFGVELPVEGVHRADVARVLGFDPHPTEAT